MQPNNNLLAEISALVLSALLILVGGALLFFGKIDTIFAGYFFVSALGVFGYNTAFKAPSPTQQAALLQLTTQALQAQVQPQLVQAPTPVLTPQLVQQVPFPVAGTSAMPQAMQTTQSYPAAPKQ